MKNFLIFGLLGVIFGVATCLSVKDDLLDRLRTCEEKLVEAVEQCTAHGLDFYRPIYQSLLLELYEYQESIQDLNNDTQVPKTFTGTIDKFEKTVLSRIKDPIPREGLKAYAIYFSAVEKHFWPAEDKFQEHSARLFKQVKSIVRQEVIIATSEPEKTHNMTLDDLYKELGDILHAAQVTASWFEGFWNLANGTRTQIDWYLTHNMTEETQELRAQLAQFDNATLALARAVPINTEAAAGHFFRLAEAHHTIQKAMELTMDTPKTAKSRLMDLVDAEERKVNTIAAEFKKQSLNYYAERLLSFHDQIEQARSQVRSISNGSYQAAWYMANWYVDPLRTSVWTELWGNAPEEKVKARALYLAAINSPRRPDDSGLSSAELKTEVQGIVDKENSILPNNATVNDRMFWLNQPTNDRILRREGAVMIDIRDMVIDLHDMMNKLEKRFWSYVIPGPEENQELEERARELLAYYKGLTGIAINSESLEKDIHIFHDETHLLNSLLPIDSSDKIAQFFNAALAHVESAAKIQRRFHKIPV